MSLQGKRKRRTCDLLRSIIEVLEESPCLREKSVEFSIGPVSEQRITGIEVKNMTVTLTDIQQFNVAVAFQDARGNPATVIAPPTWSVSDPTLLVVTAGTDGMSATVVAQGPLGTGQVTVAADGGPVAGNDPINGVLNVTVVSSAATTAVFAPSAPTP
jgi:hypothetical protein